MNSYYRRAQCVGSRVPQWWRSSQVVSSMADVILSIKLDLMELPDMINTINKIGGAEIVNISVVPAKTISMETALAWKKRAAPPPIRATHKEGALGLVAEFIVQTGVGATFTLGEVQRIFKTYGYDIHSASARLSECCQAGAIELTAQATYTVRQILTAAEIKQKRKKY